MASDRTPGDLNQATGRRWSLRDDEAALRAASLASPAFKESWRAGSPLDWSEFIARCQAPPPRVEPSETASTSSSRGAGK